jgi:SEC-C motif.
VRSYWETDNWKTEAAELAERFPQLTIRPDRDRGGITITGRLPVTNDVEYSVSIELSPGYPRVVPVMRCDPQEVEPLRDRHINEQSGEACLCVRSELRLHWPLGSSIAQFIDRLVTPFLDGQFYYDTQGHWPAERQRLHGVPGIIEAYRDFCTQLGNDSLETIEQLMRLLARKNNPKGHELCPCGSGGRLRNCHADAIKQLRHVIEPEHAMLDLRDCFPGSAR